MNKQQQINELYITRGIAIIGVILVHATSFGVTELTTDSSMFWFYNLINIFFKFGTPTFIFLSSFVLFYNYFNRPIDKNLLLSFYKKRLMYIIIPYVIFSVLYYLMDIDYYASVMTYKGIMLDFLYKLSIGKAFSHLYFVFISIQFYILFPLFLILFKKYKWLRKNAVWIGLLLQWAFVILNHEYFHIKIKGSISFSYFGYYFLGIFVGIYFKEIMTFFKKHQRLSLSFSITVLVLWIASAYYYVDLWYWTRTTGQWADTMLYELAWNVYTYFSAISLFLLSFFIYRFVSIKITNLLIHLGVVSFGVYLIHLIFLNLYQEHVPSSGISILYHLKSAGGFFATLLISWIVVGTVIKKLSWSWIIFGSTPKVMPYKEQPKISDYVSNKPIEL